MKSLLLKTGIFLSLINCIQCAPKYFTHDALHEEIISIENDTITLKKLLSSDDKEKFIQIYASYCPVSQERFKEVIAYQKKHPKKSYVFLSVDHSFIDFKHGLQYVSPKGKRYFVYKKGKGELGKFLKLKSIPRFLLIDKNNNIKKFKTSKIP